MEEELLASIPAPILKFEGPSFDNHTIEIDDLYQSLQGLKYSLLIAGEDAPHSGFTTIRLTLNEKSLKDGCISIQPFINFFGGSLMTALINFVTLSTWVYVVVAVVNKYIAEKTGQEPLDNLDILASLRNQNMVDSSLTDEEFVAQVKALLERLNQKSQLTNRYIRQMATPLKEGDTLTLSPIQNTRGIPIKYEDLSVFGKLEEDEELTYQIFEEEKLIYRSHDTKKTKLAWDFEFRNEKVKMIFKDLDYIDNLLEETAYNSFKSGDFIIADVLYDPQALRNKYTILKIHGTPFVNRA